MDLRIGTSTGYDGNGSPVEFYYVTCKKFKREFYLEEDFKKWLRAYLDGNLTECIKYGKLISKLSEVD